MNWTVLTFFSLLIPYYNSKKCDIKYWKKIEVQYVVNIRNLLNKAERTFPVSKHTTEQQYLCKREFGSPNLGFGQPFSPPPRGVFMKDRDFKDG